MFRVDPAAISAALPREETPAAAPAEAVDFGQVLRRMVDEASTAEHTAARRVEALAAGASDDIHGTMLAVKEAEIGVRLVGSVRNRLLDAFHELWRTSV